MLDKHKIELIISTMKMQLNQVEKFSFLMKSEVLDGISRAVTAESINKLSTSSYKLFFTVYHHLTHPTQRK